MPRLPRTATRAGAAGALVAAVAAAAAGTLIAAPAASAAGNQADLVTEYSSLSGALLGFYAEQSHQSLAGYLDAQQVLLAPSTVPDPVQERDDAEAADGALDAAPDAALQTPDPAQVPTASPEAPAAAAAPTLTGSGMLLPAAQASALGVTGTPVTASTVTALNRKLAAAGMTVDTSGYSSLDALASQVAANSRTPDGAVTIAGARWVSQLSSLHSAALGTPKASNPSAPGVPKGALPYGLLLDKSLTAMVTDHPDLFADAKKSGLGTTAMSKAWSSSMLKAYTGSKKDFANVLPDPCTGGMLAVMASGNPASAAKATGGKCSPSCVTGGMYLNNQTKSLFDPSRTSQLADPTAPLWNGATYNLFQGWAKDLAVSQNPSLASSLTKKMTQSNPTSGCAAAATATTSTLGKTLPGVFSSLR